MEREAHYPSTKVGMLKDMRKREKKERKPLHVSTVRSLAMAAVLAVAGIIITYCISWGYYQKTVEAKAETDIFKTFALKTLDGESFEAKQLRDTSLTAVNIWGTDCPPCISEMPELEALNNSYDDSVFRIIGVPSDVTNMGKEVIPERLEEAKRILESSGVTFTNIIPDEDMDAFLTLTVTGTPTTFFVDKEGNVIDSVVGTRPAEFWEETVERLLSEVA